jgi:hypothetical protein
MRRLKNYTLPQIRVSLGRSRQEGCGGWSMWHALERTEMCRGFWWESLKERDHLQDQRWEDGIRMDLWEIGWGGGCVWNGFNWLRIAVSGGLL